MDIGTGDLTFHADIKGPIPISRIKHLEDIWITLVAVLAEKGLTYLTTWVEWGDYTQKRFAEFFGFESTGFMKILQYDDGIKPEKAMEEMIYEFPIDDEGITD